MKPTGCVYSVWCVALLSLTRRVRRGNDDDEEREREKKKVKSSFMLLLCVKQHHQCLPGKKPEKMPNKPG